MNNELICKIWFAPIIIFFILGTITNGEISKILEAGFMFSLFSFCLYALIAVIYFGAQ